MVGWHHRLDGHEFEQGLGVGDGQGSLVCCSPWDGKESDMTEQLNRISMKLQLDFLKEKKVFTEVFKENHASCIPYNLLTTRNLVSIHHCTVKTLDPFCPPQPTPLPLQ